MAEGSASQVVEDNPELSMHMMRSMKSELAALRDAFRVELARSDFLWDRALARHLVTEEEYALARDPAQLAQHA